ncbi:MAG TPA: DPP IV N-terminal domain-containing protein [Flavobacteriales bacterium]|jgi:dipeptidyl-peptidase 4|nr:DPP IV N-terminal domain-containing protein [Flavobacteriales bacterium]
MNLRTLVLPFLIASATLLAQRQLTLRDAVLKAGTDLAPERIRGLQWITGSNTYSYVKDSVLMQGSVGKSMDAPIVHLRALNALLPDSLALRSMPAVEWLDRDRFRFTHAGRIHIHDRATGSLQQLLQLPADAANLDMAPTNTGMAFTQGNDLYVQRPGDREPIRVTSDGADGLVNGQSVHRQEYGITKGTFWSPNGEGLAFYRMDERMVTTYQLEDIGTKPSTFNAIRYPMAGQTSHQVTVGVYDLRDGSTRFLRTEGAADDYLTNISWSADGRHIHIAHLDRRTENLRLVRYDAVSGSPVATLLTEHDAKYLEPEHPARFLRTRPGQFLWQSDRDGWDHLFLHDIAKGTTRQLTKGAWNVKEVLAVDPKEGFAVVEGTAAIDPKVPTGALETHLYRVDLASGRTTRLTAEAGTHHGLLSEDGQWLLDVWSSTRVPGKVELRDTRTGAVAKTLLTSKDPLQDFTVGTIELITVPIANGDHANARLLKPSHFRPDRRYPVLIYVYNGPHVQLVTNSFLGGASHWMLEAAERGYLVWTLDGHGSAHRGRAFEQAVHRQLGVTEVKDQLEGVEHLKRYPFVDAGRIAVHGWSFGGHMTTAMLTRHPEVFAVGVAGGPVMDWSLYEVMYTERYMDTPTENPEGYANTALPALADQLQDDLLLITGGADDVVLPQHSLSFVKACVSKGIPVDFFDYPGHGHNVRGKDRLHLMEKVLHYVDQRLLPQR